MSVQLNRSATKKEKAKAKASLDALTEALSPETETQQGPDTSAVLAPGEVGPPIAIPGKTVTTERQKTPQEVIGALGQADPALATQTLAQIAQAQLTAVPKDTRGELQKGFEFAKSVDPTMTLTEYLKLRKTGGVTVNTGRPPPTGFEELPDGSLRPIPGGPKDTLTPEAAGRVALLASGKASMDELNRLVFKKDGSVDRAAVTSAWLGLPTESAQQISLHLLNALNVKIRIESGAAVPETEVERMKKTFEPKPTDRDATVRAKFDLLGDFLDGAFDLVQRDGRLDAKRTIDRATKALENKLDRLGVNAEEDDIAINDDGVRIQLVDGVWVEI